ncbi:MAG TPA: hypothetical protein VMK16_12795 [Acidimicrobiales bacterium]|nr:hypothetical protein [Acidimicrobiales bacterium]
MRKRVAAAGLAAGLAGGAIAGIALTHPSISGAQTDTTTATTTAPAQTKPDRGEWMQDALKPLVDNGTITQSQADAVISALEAAKPPMGRGGPGGPGGPGFGFGFGRGAGLGGVASALGITNEELRTALQSGQTLAQIAEAHGKTAQDVVDALVADAKAHLDDAVKAGKITQADADQKLAEITDTATKIANGQMPARPEFHGGHHDGPDDTSPAAPGTSTA